MKKNEWLRDEFRHVLPKTLWRIAGMGMTCCVLLLDGVDIWTAAYALLLGWLVYLPFLLWQLRQSRMRWRVLRGILQSPAPTAEYLPEAGTSAEDVYRVLSEELILRNARERTESMRRQAEAREYYTLWTHQIKTPIAALRLLFEDCPSENIGEMKDELLRIEQYVEMALRYLRLESESTDYTFRHCDADILMRSVIRKHGREFIRRHLRMEYHALEYSPLTDEKWLGFVFDQVLSNALKYTMSGGISVYREGEDTVVIQDTGIGIRAEDLPRVFEKGYTGQNGRIQKSSTGIGLYLCRQICARLGHTISIESTVGRGTKVSICLRSYPRSPTE